MSLKSLQAYSEALTPHEVKNKEFKKVPLGYSPHQVVEFLDSLSKCWEKVQRKEKDLLIEVQTLSAEITAFKNKESEVELIRQKAHEEAAVIREQGRQEAEKHFKESIERSENIRQKTEEWLTTIITKVEETERRRNSFMNAFKAALDQHYELLNTDLNQNEGLEFQLSKFLANMTKNNELPTSPENLI